MANHCKIIDSQNEIFKKDFRGTSSNYYEICEKRKENVVHVSLYKHNAYKQIQAQVK